MFNPNQFVRGNLPSQDSKPSSRPTGRIILEKMTDHSKTRWDEPIQVPEVLYQKFKLPVFGQGHRQSKRYPISLIDYIKRAYSKCKDDLQTRAIEAELRKIIAKHDDNLEAVNWEETPLPNLQEQRRLSSSIAAIASLRDISIKKDTPPTKEYVQNLGPKEEAPPQTKLKVQTTLQRLEEKLSKKEEGKLEPEKKTFIGFKSEPDVYQPPVIKSEISPHLRTIFSNPPPPPPPPKNHKKQITDAFSSPSSNPNASHNPSPNPHPPSQSKELSLRFVKPSEKSEKKDDKILDVVTCTVPEPIPDKKRVPIKPQAVVPQISKPAQSLRQKQKSKLVMSRKQFTEVAKAAGQGSDIYSVAKRYAQFNRLKPDVIKSVEQYDDDLDECNEIIVGRSTCIDKPYLRITGRPDADTVRPEPILKKALAHFLREHKQATTPYDQLISQFKSIRQDLTVQHIRNSFTVLVYEENFKMSLFQNDIIQVKHCQANLWQLYRQGLIHTQDARDTFISYHLITLVLEEKDVELEYMLTLLPPPSLLHHAVKDSLRLKKIFLLGNYRAFFDFYNSRDEICRKLLNIYIDKVRMKCLVMFSKTCGERMSFSLLSETVGEDEDVLQALAVGEGAVVRQGYFMLKQSFQKLSKSDFLVIKKVTNLLI